MPHRHRIVVPLLWLASVLACSGDDDSPNLDPDAGSSCGPGEFGPSCEPCDCQPGDVCSDGADGDGSCTSAISITLDFERIDAEGLSPFRVRITLVNHDTPIEGAMPVIDIPVGVASDIEEVGGGVYELVVTPERTGEHPITVTHEGVTVTRTAVVLEFVHAGWDQAQSVPGLVNTDGYEDGGTVTADGEYLFVHTGPVYMSSYFLFVTPRDQGGCGGQRLVPDRCTHPWLDETIGPTGPPERPGFFDGRFADGAMLHNSNLYGVADDEAPIIGLPTMFYGFRRQADGSYAEPFYLAFDDANDAIASPFGVSMSAHGDGTATMAFAFDDPNPTLIDLDGDLIPDEDSRHDIYTLEVELGQDTILGELLPTTLESGLPPARGSFFPSARVNLGDTGSQGAYGTQGNPHIHADSTGAITSVWTDDEYDTDEAQIAHEDFKDLSVYVLTSGSFPSGSFTKVTLPAPINTAAEEIQPFFVDDGLYFTRDIEIAFAAYAGTLDSAALGNAGNWSEPERILGKSVDWAIGEAIAIGEPSIATIDGVEHLFFMYGVIRGFDAVSGLPDINMQMGVVSRRP